MNDRRLVLAGVVLAVGVLTATILLDVIGTILFALTVAYVLIPVQQWLMRRGIGEWVAAVLATLTGLIAVLAVFVPVLATLYFRVDDIVAIVRELPTDATVTVVGTTVTVDATEFQGPAIAYLRDIAISLASALPVLAIKFALFVIVLFALLLKSEEAGRAAMAPVPREYRDIPQALATRARETLNAIYVLQVATAAGTMAVAYPLFWLLGYEEAFMIALLGGILQFIPMIGPSLVIVPIAVYELAVGNVVGAILVGGLGLVLVAWLPDMLVRPRLSRYSGGLPGSLYFIGFTGGLFTLGPIGIVVGPLVVALFVESMDLLADEVDGDSPFADLGATPDDDEAAVHYEDATADPPD